MTQFWNVAHHLPPIPNPTPRKFLYLTKIFCPSENTKVSRHIAGGEPDDYSCKTSGTLAPEGNCEVRLTNQTDNITFACPDGWNYNPDIGQTIVTEVFEWRTCPSRPTWRSYGLSGLRLWEPDKTFHLLVQKGKTYGRFFVCAGKNNTYFPCKISTEHKSLDKNNNPERPGWRLQRCLGFTFVASSAANINENVQWRKVEVCIYWEKIFGFLLLEGHTNWAAKQIRTSLNMFLPDVEKHRFIHILQWDLVCTKNYLMETSQTVFSGGVTLGALLFPVLADRIGRKPVHLLCQWLLVVVGFVTAFSPSFVFFAVCRFLAGALREVSNCGAMLSCTQFCGCSACSAFASRLWRRYMYHPFWLGRQAENVHLVFLCSVSKGQLGTSRVRLGQKPLTSNMVLLKCWTNQRSISCTSAFVQK